jgi:hypothetical protein
MDPNAQIQNQPSFAEYGEKDYFYYWLPFD